MGQLIYDKPRLAEYPQHYVPLHVQFYGMHAWPEAHDPDVILKLCPATSTVHGLFQADQIIVSHAAEPEEPRDHRMKNQLHWAGAKFCEIKHGERNPPAWISRVDYMRYICPKLYEALQQRIRATGSPPSPNQEI